MLVLLALGSTDVHAAVPFPAEGDWVPLTVTGAPVTDVSGDLAVTLPAPPDPDPSLDLLGIPAEPALAWWIDLDTLFLRMRVEDNADTVDGGWTFLLDTDADPATYERTLSVEGPTHEVLGFVNTTGAPGTWVLDRATTDPAGYGQDSTGESESTFVLGKYYVSVQLPLATLETDFGIDASTPFRVAAATTQLWRFGLEDVAGCDGSAGSCDDLVALGSDPVTIDGDADGLPTTYELQHGTDPADADTDDDGSTDGTEATDAMSDPLVCDTDGDGLPDGLERGVDTPDPDTDLAAGCFRADTDTDTVTVPNLADSDGGSLADGLEDRDADGAQDAWETDPMDPSDDVDTDGDGIPDALDDRVGAGPDVDSDGDGIDDATEGLVDTDGDGTPDFADLDSDGDGIDDATEGTVDTDGDGVPDFRDDDSDGDGIPDAVEGDVDTDGDGVPDFRDEDSDDDGIPDVLEGTDDTDGDGVPDRHDGDSDSDGLTDDQEGAEDTDGDGVPDFRDDDSDGDGVSDLDEGLDDEGDVADSDGDGNPDVTDTDSDNDGIPDGQEGDGDADCDGVPDRVDTDDEDSFCDTATPPTVDTDVDPPDETDPLRVPGQFTGGACDVAGGASVGPLALLLAVGLLRRRRRAVAVGVAAAAPATALAQDDVDAERLAVSVDGGALTVVEDVAPLHAAGVSVFVDHADDPLVFRPVVGDPVDVLSSVTTARVAVFSGVGPLRIGAEAPLHLYAAGLDLDGPTHLGDLRLSSKLVLVKPRPLGAGLFFDAGLPTGPGADHLGAGVLTAHGGAIGTVTGDAYLVSATVGVRSGTGAELGDLTVSPALTAGLGGAVRVVKDTWLAAELSGEGWLGNPGQAGDLPAELLLTGRRTVRDVDLVLGGGPGLTRGVGSPDFRLLMGVRWSPAPAAAPPPAPVPAPPPAPEVVAPSTGHVVVRAIDPAGRPFPAAQIRFVGTAGDPLRTGPDGIVEVDRPPGDVEITAAADGWAAKGHTLRVDAGDTEDVTVMLFPSEVRIDREAKQIFLVDKVFFEVDKAELVLASLATLDALAKALLEHPEIARVRIEGHTDATGTDEHNLELSQQRAEAVRTYLVKQGVAADRLEAKGMGEGHPLQPGDSEEVYATNRRVEFHLVEPTPAP